MNRNKLSKFLIFLMFFIFGANYIALKLYWYSSIFWFDMFMHFMGGFWVGLFFIWFFCPKDTSWKSIFKIFAFVFFIGVLWELFELYAHNYIGRDTFDMLDTLSDLSFDLAGGGFAVFYFFKKRIMSGKESK